MNAHSPRHSGSIEHISPHALRPCGSNARTHSPRQVRAIAASIEAFGFLAPVLVGGDGEIIAGHGRVEAAKLLGLATVPAVRVSHLTEAERRAYVLADNRIALDGGWDQEILAIELGGLAEVGFDVQLTGFSAAEINFSIGGGSGAGAAAPRAARAGARRAKVGIPTLDNLPDLPAGPLSQPGDLWGLGRHRLLCGGALNAGDFRRLMGAERARLVFTEAPSQWGAAGGGAGDWGDGVGDGAGHLLTALRNVAAHAVDGAVAFVGADWRHAPPTQLAAGAAFGELLDLVVWERSGAAGDDGGGLYLPSHGLLFAYKIGAGPHTGNVGDCAGGGDCRAGGGGGRTNLWLADGAADPPAAMPAAVAARAVRDCSQAGDIVLDPFGGSGVTLIAAQEAGRTCRMLEADPRHCDLIIRRFEAATGERAVRLGGGAGDSASVGPGGPCDAIERES